MSVYRRTRAGQKSKIYDFKFMLGGRTFRGSTGQITRDAALAFERQERDRQRQIAAGLAQDMPRDGISFAEWAEHFYLYKSRKIARPDALEWQLRAILRFFGRRPRPGSRVPIHAGAPYHDLRLTDVTADPYWIERFETYIRATADSPHTRNHYRKVLRQLFTLAADPRFRSRTGVVANPVPPDLSEPTRPRSATLSPDAVRAILSHASYHVRLAIAIGILAPKLRISSILGLKWKDNISPDLSRIIVVEHKTAHVTGRPQVYPIPAQLRAILADARTRSRSAYVVTYRGRPVKAIIDGVRAAADAAGVPYGLRTPNGITFHSLRHSAASTLAALGVSPLVQRDLMGHSSIDMTAYYTHTEEPQIRDVAERLSAAFQIESLVTAPGRRAVRRPGPGAQNGDHSRRETTSLPSTPRDAKRHRRRAENADRP